VLVRLFSKKIQASSLLPPKIARVACLLSHARGCAYCHNRQSTMTTIELITSVERRWRCSRKEKLRMVAESARPD
jgi:hypothetical protein